MLRPTVSAARNLYRSNLRWAENVDGVVTLNFFFFTCAPGIQAQMTIAKFQNCGRRVPTDIQLYGVTPRDGKWHVYPAGAQENEHFWALTATDENLHDVFFLATEAELEEHDLFADGLCSLNDVTDTAPDYRANLIVSNEKGGFSSYQSEFPSKMLGRRGDLLTPIYTLSNPQAARNIIFIRSVFDQPITEPYKAHVVDKATARVEAEFDLACNRTNVVELPAALVRPGTYLYAKGFLGVPIYLSESADGHLSFEHTHPPHSSVGGPRKFALVRDYKNAVAAAVEQREEA